jgi:GNAT superfamily N-acetyltransferase
MSALAYEDVWLPLERGGAPLTSSVTVGPVAADAVAVFDYSTDGHSGFTPWRAPELGDWQIGAIVGASGTGKSTLLREFGSPDLPAWGVGAIADHFTDAHDAAGRLYAVGLSSVPTWVKPYAVLSTGEKFRADLARMLHDGAVIDEYTSVVDRNVARAASRAFGKYVRDKGLSRIAVATCHRDVLPWLKPDWVIDTDGGVYARRPRGCLHREPLVVDIYEVNRSMWAHFVEHHYLNGNLHPFARCYVATLHGIPVAFAAAIPFPHATIRNAWRGHRVVTLPDYQGLGIGPRLADWLAEAHYRAGYNYYAKTTHPRLGEYRDASPYWQATSHGRRNRPSPHRAPVSFGTRKVNAWIGSTRSSYSHRYVGGFGVAV